MQLAQGCKVLATCEHLLHFYYVKRMKWSILSASVLIFLSSTFNSCVLKRILILTCFKALFHLSQESTRKLAESIFIQSQCSKVYFNEMHTLAASLRVGFAISGKQALGWHWLLFVCLHTMSNVSGADPGFFALSQHFGCLTAAGVNVFVFRGRYVLFVINKGLKRGYNRF